GEDWHVGGSVFQILKDLMSANRCGVWREWIGSRVIQTWPICCFLYVVRVETMMGFGSVEVLLI
ncbi:hypothetical protein U1Q18_045849, partial [Sarracenia purpurea var. burkii]